MRVLDTARTLHAAQAEFAQFDAWARAGADAWLAVARLADSAVVSNKAEWKAVPALYVSVTLDQARALLRCGLLPDAKRALGTLRAVAAAKHTWGFFFLLALIEARQGARCAVAATRTRPCEPSRAPRCARAPSPPPARQATRPPCAACSRRRARCTVAPPRLPSSSAASRPAARASAASQK